MKLKTNKAAKKRFTTSARGKFRHRRVHQSHLNSKDTGEQTRRKHASTGVDIADYGRVKDLLPYG